MAGCQTATAECCIALSFGRVCRFVEKEEKEMRWNILFLRTCAKSREHLHCGVAAVYRLLVQTT